MGRSDEVIAVWAEERNAGDAGEGDECAKQLCVGEQFTQVWSAMFSPDV